jgi:hypothetical protein
MNPRTMTQEITRTKRVETGMMEMMGTMVAPGTSKSTVLM